MKKMNQQMRVIISLVLTAVFAALYFYFTLPALNIQSTDLYFFLITIAVVYYAIYMLLSMRGMIKRTVDENGRVVFTSESDGDDYTNVERDPYLAKKKQSKQRAPLYIAGLLFVIVIVGTIGSSPIFHADAYTRLITIEPGNFEEDIDELSFDQIPWLDRASAQRLGDRRMGELADIVSQF
ncbi:MAG: hypothetical protein LBE57_01020, partial [Methanosarcinales archaeon]|nr:hypothetical protein [Methanosarcinales archaeon]